MVSSAIFFSTRIAFPPHMADTLATLTIRPRPLLGLVLLCVCGSGIVHAAPRVKEFFEKSEEATAADASAMKPEADVDLAMDLPQMIDPALQEKAREEKAASEAIQALNQALLKAMADYPINEASLPVIPTGKEGSILRAKPEEPKNP